MVKSYCLNDSVLQDMSLDNIKKTLKYYIDAVKFVNGQFVSNWELRSISNHLKYKKLQTSFNEMNSYAGH